MLSAESFGYGTYRFYVDTAPQKIDRNVTLGLFTWSDAPGYAHREIDVECGTWGNASDANNAQFVVQPYRPRGHLIRYYVPESEALPSTVFCGKAPGWTSNA